MLISVVICTHNRANLLAGLLESLSKQTEDIKSFEIIVVDNASTDATCRVVTARQQSMPNLRYSYEQNIGVSHARNRGAQEARGVYVAYLDDDCKIPPEYVENVLRIARELKPDIFGGPIHPFYNSPKPSWFRDAYASHIPSETEGTLSAGKYLYGSNMIVRSELIREIGGFLPDLGMAGEKIAFGEEIQLQKDLRARHTDLVVIYSPSLRLYHLVRSKKFRLTDAAYRAFVSGKYYFYIHPQSDTLYRTCRHLLRLVAEVFLDLAVRAWTRSRLRFPSTQNYIYEKTVQHIFNIGYTYEMLLTKSGPGK